MLLIACTPAEHVSLKREDVARVAVKIPSAVVDVVPPALAPRPEPSPVDGFVFDGQTLSVEGSAEVLADPDVAYFHTELSARDVPMRFSQPMQLADAISRCSTDSEGARGCRHSWRVDSPSVT